MTQDQSFIAKLLKSRKEGTQKDLEYSSEIAVDIEFPHVQRETDDNG